MYQIENQTIGLLIGYYRKKLSALNFKFSRYEIVKEKSQLVRELCKVCTKVCASRPQICSAKTSLILERGDPIKNTCYYIDFSNKLNKQYILNKRTINLITYSEKKLITLIKYYHRDELIKFREFIVSSIDAFPDVIYITELLQLYLAIVDYMLYFKLPNQNFVEIYEYIYSKVHPSTQFLIAYLLCKFYKYSMNDKDKVCLYLDELISNSFNNFEIKLLDLQRHLSIIEFYNTLTKIQHVNASFYEELLVKMYLADINLTIKNYKKSLAILNQIMDDLKNTDIPLSNVLLEKALTKKGTVLYYMGQYDNAFKLYKEVFEVNPDLLSYDFVTFIYCLDKSNQKIYLNKFINLKTYKNIQSVVVKKIYYYYMMKYNGKSTIKNLMQYVLNDLKDCIPDNTAAFDIMKEELVEYINMRNIKQTYIDSLMKN